METEEIFFSEMLESNVLVIGQPMAGVESAALGILIGTGARDEGPGQYGVSHFTEQMLFRGTEHLDARALSERFDALGIEYDATAGLEMTVLTAVLIGDRLPAAIDLLADVIRYPAFPADAIDQVRSTIVQELRQREDRPGQKMMDGLRQRFFAGSPLGNDSLGTEENVDAMQRQDIHRYWTERYVANNIIVSVAGNFDWPATVEQLRRVTRDWPQGTGRLQMDIPPTHAGAGVIERDTSQEAIGFAFPGVAAGDPRYYTAALLAQALGGGMNSRLFQEVREKHGLAYAVGARFDGLEVTGLFRVSVGTSTELAHKSVEVIMEELRKLVAGGITEDELTLAKTRLKSQLIMRSESTSARMAANLRSWWFEGRLRGLQEIKDRIDRVSTADVDDLLRDVGVLQNLAVFAVGPRTEEELFGALLARS